MVMPDIVVRPMHAAEVGAADQVMRVAFGTFLGMPDPASFGGDADLVRSRFIADPSAAFTAEVRGNVAGSSFATNWGTAGFFGPLSVRPDLWDQGVGRRLIEPVMERFSQWGTRHAGLFTFANSAKHIGLYQRFGFWPRFLTVIMDTPVAPAAPGGPPAPATLLSSVADADRDLLLAGVRELTGSLYDGLDLTHEIEQASSQRIGETIVTDDDCGVAGVAVCQFGPGSEGGTGTCYAKFAAVRSGPDAAAAFGRLLGACEAFARGRGLNRVVAGVNTARADAYRALLARGYRPGLYGVAMHRPNDPGYSRPDVFVIDDWR